VQVAGFIVREASRRYSNWRAAGSLQDYLPRRDRGAGGRRHARADAAPALGGRDARGIAGADVPVDELLAAHPGAPAHGGARPHLRRLDGPSRTRSSRRRGALPRARLRLRHQAHSLKLLAERGCAVTTLPATTPAEEILEQEFDGFFVSNGPGDPEAVGTRCGDPRAGRARRARSSASASGTSSSRGRSAARPTSCSTATARGTTRCAA
jgi:carbamoyl-phosphate synthase small subunit